MVFDRKTYARAYYLRNREKFLAARAAYVEANRDKVLALNRAYFAANKTKVRAKQKEYYGKNADALCKSNKEWRDANPEWIKAYQERTADRKAVTDAAKHIRNREKNLKRMAEWMQRNPDKARANGGKKRAALRNACPIWADIAAIKAIYTYAIKLERETGTKHHVDHIIPLQGKTVCGLHVSWNLRAIPATENMKKKNKLIEDLICDGNDASGHHPASP